MPVLPAPRRCADVRLWVDGCWPGVLRAAPGRSGDGPLVLWASQTGNAEGFAAGWQTGSTVPGCSRWTTSTLDDLAAGATSWSSPARSATAGRPTTAPTSGTGSTRPDAPTLDGVRYAVLGIGDRSYAEFCGHAKSLDRRLADLGATRLVDRVECEAYDDEPMAQWADRVVDAVGGSRCGRAAATGDADRGRTPNRSPGPRPLRAPLCRNVLLTPRRPRPRRCGSSASTSPSTTSAYAVGRRTRRLRRQRADGRRCMAGRHRSGGRRTRPGRRRRGRPA